MSLTVISYGGGVQSTAMVVLAATGRLGHDVNAALFANVGDDSEHPATLDYVHNVAIPWAAERGLEIHELQKRKRDGSVGTLWEELHRINSITIPVRTSDTGQPMGRRSCTIDYKVKVVDKWLKANGATEDDPATVLVGISTDEIMRAKGDRAGMDLFRRRAYPLIDLNLDRAACQQEIIKVGLPAPPKSSCFFCPYHRPAQWAELRRDDPDLFEKSAELEDELNRRRSNSGKDPVYLTRFGIPIRKAITEAQDMLPLFSPDTETCDEGYCWT